MVRMFRALPRRALALLDPPGGFWLLAAAYLTLQFGLRLVMMPAASQDDAEQLIVAQTLAGGYTPSQPPLYTWLVIAAERVFGPGVFAVVFVKYLCQLVTLGFSYLAARRALGDRRLAAAAAAGLIAVYYVGWETVFNYSHTPLWMAAMAATLWALLRVGDAPTIASYAALGIAVGVGLLSKYGYGVFLVGLAVGVAAEPTLRRTLLHGRASVTLAAALLVTLPHLLWLAGGGADPAAMQERLTVAGDAGYWEGVGNALAKLANALVSFWFPLWLILLAAFPGAWRRRAPTSTPTRRLLAVALAASLAIVVAAILTGDLTTFRTHYAVLFLAAPLWVFLRLQALGIDERALGRYAAAVFATALVFLVGVPVKAVVEPQTCSNCYYNMPYAALAEEIRRGGFQRGTVIAHFWRIQIGGNLRAEFPDSRVVSTKYPFAVPPPPAAGDQCLLVWDPRAGEAPPADLLRFARETVGARLPEPLDVRIAEARMAWARERTAALAYAVVDGGC